MSYDMTPIEYEETSHVDCSIKLENSKVFTGVLSGLFRMLNEKTDLCRTEQQRLTIPGGFMQAHTLDVHIENHSQGILGNCICSSRSSVNTSG